MIRSLVAALAFEVRTLLRTREVLTTAIVPALLFMPLVVLWTILLMSLFQPDPTSTLALPADAPLSLVDPGDLDVTVVQHADPEAALVAGDADAAIVAWSVHEEPGEPWLRGRAMARDPIAAHRLETYLLRAARAALDERVEAAGGAAGVDRRLVSLEATPAVTAGATELGRLRRVLLAAWVVIVVSLSLIALPLRTAADRVDGVLEAWAVTPAGVGPLLFVRIVSTTALFLVMSLLFPAGFLRVIPTVRLGLGVGDLLEVVLAVLVANTLQVATGLVSTSTRSANQLAGITLTVLGGGTGLSMLTDDWPWVPMVGFGLSHDPIAQAVRLLWTAGFLVALLTLLPRLAEGARSLPAGERDD